MFPGVATDTPTSWQHLQANPHTTRNIPLPPWEEDYQVYRRKIMLWNKVTTLNHQQRGPAVLLTLGGKALQCALLVDDADLNELNGIDKLFEQLDKEFLPDDNTTRYTEIVSFCKIQRQDESIFDFINRYDKKRVKCQSRLSTVLPTELSATLLIESARVSFQERAMIMATAQGKFDYTQIQTAMKQLFPAPQLNKKAFVAQDTPLDPDGSESEIEYQEAYIQFKKAQGRLQKRLKSGNNNNNNKNSTNPTGKKWNPSDKITGVPIRCYLCGSQFHLLPECPKRATLAPNQKQEDKPRNEANITTPEHDDEQQEIFHADAFYPIEREDTYIPKPPTKRPPALRWDIVGYHTHSKPTPAAPDTPAYVHKRYPVKPQPHAPPLVQIPRPPILTNNPSTSSWYQDQHEQGHVIYLQDDQYAFYQIDAINKQSQAIVDLGATATLISKSWYNQHQVWQEQNGLLDPPFVDTSALFIFGNGEKTPPLKTGTIFVGLAGKVGTIKTYLTDQNVPPLFSKKTLKSLKCVIDTEKDTIFSKALQRSIPVETNKAGHYIINLNDLQQVKHEPAFYNEQLDFLDTIKIQETEPAIEFLANNSTNVYGFTGITLTQIRETTGDQALKQLILKIHKNYGHASPSQIKKLFLEVDKLPPNFFNLLGPTVKECQICQKYDDAPAQPIIGSVQSNIFNEIIQLDLFFIDQFIYLIITDTASRYTSALRIPNKNTETVWQYFFSYGLRRSEFQKS